MGLGALRCSPGVEKRLRPSARLNSVLKGQFDLCVSRPNVRITGKEHHSEFKLELCRNVFGCAGNNLLTTFPCPLCYFKCSRFVLLVFKLLQ